MERLDELEETWHERLVVDDDVLASEVYDEVLALIAQAKRTEAAERERDALRAAMVTIAKHAMEEHSCGDPDVVAALAQPAVAGGAE